MKNKYMGYAGTEGYVGSNLARIITVTVHER